MRSAASLAAFVLCVILAAGCRSLLSSRTLADGGDRVPWALPEPDGTISGVNAQDTLARAHQPALDNTFIESSNEATVERPETYAVTGTWSALRGSSNLSVTGYADASRLGVAVSGEAPAISTARLPLSATESAAAPATAAENTSASTKPTLLAAGQSQAALMPEHRLHVSGADRAVAEAVATTGTAHAGAIEDAMHTGPDGGTSHLRAEEGPQQTGVSGATFSVASGRVEAVAQAKTTADVHRAVLGASGIRAELIDEGLVPILMATADSLLTSGATVEPLVTEAYAGFDGQSFYVAATEGIEDTPRFIFDAMIMPEEWPFAEGPAVVHWAPQAGALTARTSALDDSASEGTEAGRTVHTILGRSFPTATVGTQVESGARLNLTKIASSPVAYPGQIVTFYIRYTNTTRFVLEDLRIVDSLTAEFIYVTDSARSSRPAEITVTENEVGSSRITWQVEGKLSPGDAGTVALKAQVR